MLRSAGIAAGRAVSCCPCAASCTGTACGASLRAPFAALLRLGLVDGALAEHAEWNACWHGKRRRSSSSGFQASQAAVSGLAYVSPSLLPIWEAQFGDFHNTAQVVVDTYLGSGETKWGLQSALTMLLPHGFDGAGPEHSSSRLERFLQLANESLTRQPFVPNLHVVNVTTAANYFHLLRRQMKREYRKPLVVASPKGLLRFPAATSSLADLAPGTAFQPVLTEQVDDPSKVERVIILSGKLYYDLVTLRKEKGLEGKVVFIRVEELSPFPYAALSAALSPFTSARSLFWAQDEPENAGAYMFALPRLQQLLPLLPAIEGGVQYAGRPAMATIAPGYKALFVEQQREIERRVFEGL
ncbi:hypothetical protein JCM6882_005142 [Rhodosporidiobolus microsporus]